MTDPGPVVLNRHHFRNQPFPAPAFYVGRPESHLVCSCVRKDGSGDCHAKVIARAWRWWAREHPRSPSDQIKGRLT